MPSPVQVTIRYDTKLRPSGRGWRSEKKAAAHFDDTLKRTVLHIGELVQRKLNELALGGSDMRQLRLTAMDVNVDMQPYVLTTRSNTFFVEVRLDQDGPYRAVSDALRTEIVGGILNWFGCWPSIGLYLEFNMIFVPMSGMRVLFDRREIRDSWGETQEFPIGSRLLPTSS